MAFFLGHAVTIPQEARVGCGADRDSGDTVAELFYFTQ